jgi:hypothetical protein
MKKIFLPVLIFFYTSAMAWGPTGHRATGWVADKHLTKKARKALERILNGQSLAMASTWMDEIRSDTTYNYMVDWHWVTIHEGNTYESEDKNPNGDIIATIERVIAELKSGQFTGKEEADRVKILIHLIGDLHQPLHVGIGTDRGGNDIKVKWFGADSNLHRVWDSDMIDDTKLSYTELAQSLHQPDAVTMKNWQGSSVREWARESMTYRTAVYATGNGRLGYRYSFDNFEIVRIRLLQAGIRLAGVFNEIYG